MSANTAVTCLQAKAKAVARSNGVLGVLKKGEKDKHKGKSDKENVEPEGPELSGF